MIVLRIQGGLGNQLFQYATGRALSLHLNKKLFFNTSGLDKPVDGHLQRAFMLRHFEVKGNVATEALLTKVARPDFWKVLFSKKQIYYKQLVFGEEPPTSAPYKNTELHVEPHTYRFYKHLFNDNHSVLILDGYWQSFKFFEKYNDIIKKDLTFNFALNKENNQLLEKIQNTHSVSLHVRRSDYLNTVYGNQYFKQIPIDYYEKSLKLIEKKYDDISLYVFSDDIEWCKKNFMFNDKMVYVFNDEPAIDMFLMSKCKHNIIVNSTFSWWAAWLNANKNKTIITPSEWYKNVPDSDMHDLLPASWIKL